MTALTFGNVHGVYKPGNVKLRPEILKEIQEAVGAQVRLKAGSRSTWSSTAARARCAEEIRAAVDYGVVKMNVDTDTQYAFTRPVADHMFANYDGVLKVDGEVGNKKAYDPRAWGKAAEAGMAARVVEACEDLRSAGTTRSGPDHAAPTASTARSSRERPAPERRCAAAPQPACRGRSKNSTATSPSTSTAAGSSIACAIASLNGPRPTCGQPPPDRRPRAGET